MVYPYIRGMETHANTWIALLKTLRRVKQARDKTHTVSFHLHEMFRTGTSSRPRGWGRRENGEGLLVHKGFLFRMIKMVWN